MRRRLRLPDVLCIALLTVGAVALHGYHFGIEDQLVALSAVKRHLDPTLFPHDADALIEMTLTFSDDLVAWSIRASHLPVDVAVFSWHLASMFLFALGCWVLVGRVVGGRASAFAAVATVIVLLPFPVAGTHLGLMEQYFHPRGLAIAAVLFAFVASLDRRPEAIGWLVVAGLVHPLVAGWAALHVAAQAVPLERLRRLRGPVAGGLIAAVSLPASASSDAVWRGLMNSPQLRYYFPLRWAWYEWVGALVPLVALVWMARARRQHDASDEGRVFSGVAERLAISGAIGVLISVFVTSVPDPRLAATQPMRCLHLVYVVWFLFGGAIVADRWLKARPGRWTLYFVPLCVVVALAQRHFPFSPYVEWPGVPVANSWVQAYDWVRRSTPRDALFAMNPRYYREPGSDSHAFRPLAERSVLSESVTSIGAAVLSPALAVRYVDEINALDGWHRFTIDDMRRLRRRYGVTWVLLEQPGIAGLPCPYRNERVLVCRID